MPTRWRRLSSSEVVSRNEAAHGVIRSTARDGTPSGARARLISPPRSAPTRPERLWPSGSRMASAKSALLLRRMLISSANTVEAEKASSTACGSSCVTAGWLMCMVPKMWLTLPSAVSMRNSRPFENSPACAGPGSSRMRRRASIMSTDWFVSACMNVVKAVTKMI